MATVTEEPKAVEAGGGMIATDRRFVIYNVPWEGYEMMLKILDDRPIRVSYHLGTLELMSPGIHHEEIGRLFGLLVQAVAEELDIPCIGLKSTTWKLQLKNRGLEPDECFYLANTEHVLARGKQIDLDIDPPPDLCIEVEITRSAADRMDIYAGLEVPEVWHHDGKTLRVSVLQPDGTYADREISPSLPFLPMDEVFRLIALGDGMDHSRWGKLVRAWVREVLVPRYQPPAGRAD
jgi:Uma2 family endonuclease